MPVRPQWKIDAAEGTFWCERGEWVATVTPGRYDGHPGWDIEIWLHEHKPGEPASQAARDHLSSGEDPEKSLVWALQYAEGLLKAKAKGNES